MEEKYHMHISSNKCTDAENYFIKFCALDPVMSNDRSVISKEL